MCVFMYVLCMCIYIYTHKRRWEDNIKMGLQEVGYGDMDWIDLAQDRDR